MTKILKKQSFLKGLRLFLAVAGALAGAVFCLRGADAWAQACDPQFMDAVEARGFMEGAREVAQNQNLIFKADSVMEYSCFEEHLRPVVSGASFYMTDAVLRGMVGDPLRAHFDDGYTHPYLGGRLPSAPGGTLCNAMTYVWAAGMCFNFYNQPGMDRFYDLTFFTTNDPRRLPAGRPACPVPYTGVNMPVASAYNNRQAAWTLAPPNSMDNVPYRGDVVVMYDNLIDPPGGTVVCEPPIPTGLTVARTGRTPASFAEKFCPNPSCYYNAEQDRCEQ